MQECQNLGAEYVASKHYAVSLHRLAAALEILLRLSVALASTAQILIVCLLIHLALCVPYIMSRYFHLCAFS